MDSVEKISLDNAVLFMKNGDAPEFLSAYNYGAIYSGEAIGKGLINHCTNIAIQGILDAENTFEGLELYTPLFINAVSKLNSVQFKEALGSYKIALMSEFPEFLKISDSYSYLSPATFKSFITGLDQLDKTHPDRVQFAVDFLVERIKDFVPEKKSYITVTPEEFNEKKTLKYKH